MDRKIEKKGIPLKKAIPIIGICIIAAFLAYQVIMSAGETRLNVDPDRITISPVKYGEFHDYYPFDGTVVPEKSVYLDVEEGGKVEKIFIEGGEPVKKGDLILRFSNDTFQRSSIDTENNLLENLDRLQNTQIQLAQDRLSRKETLLDLEYQIQDLGKNTGVIKT